ncbi:MAG: hypothetical protein AB1744_10710 [Candidatus Zixiibacteriota bacterium]
METIYHQTDLRAALSILASGAIFGRDGFAVPNFSLIEKDFRNQLEGRGIELAFAWPGEVGRTYGMNGLKPDVLYHQSSMETSFSYWRSFILPGSRVALRPIGFKVTADRDFDPRECDLARLEAQIAADRPVVAVHPAHFVTARSSEPRG